MKIIYEFHLNVGLNVTSRKAFQQVPALVEQESDWQKLNVVYALIATQLF